MKAINRFLSLTMVFLLLCGLLPGFAYADDPVSGSIVLSNASGNAGDTVTVDVAVMGNPGVMAMRMEPEFDATVLELKDTVLVSTDEWTKGAGGQVLFDHYPDSDFTGKVVTYTFKILENANPGDTQVKLAVKAANYKEDLVAFEVTPATISVGGETGKLDISIGHTAALGNRLSLIYLIPVEAVEGYELDRMEIRQVHYTGEGEDFEWREYTLTTWDDYTLGGKNYKRMEFNNIAAKEMGDEVYATLYLTKDGVSYENTVDVYSLKQYAYNRLEKSSDAVLKTLLVDMLNYGAQAQVYLKYHTVALVNEALTPDQQAMGTTEMPELHSAANKVETPGASAFFYGKTLVVGSVVEIKYLMQFGANKDEAPADTVKLVLTYTKVNGGTVTVTIPASQFVYDSRYATYDANLTGIAAKDMCCAVTAKIYDGDTLISNVEDYSIETYAKNRLENSQDETLKELLRCLMKYGISAENYFS